MSERDFWIEYLKSKFFNDTAASSSTGSAHLDPYYQEISDSPTEAGESNFKISNFCDVSRSEEDHSSNYLRYERESAANDPAWNSLRQFNKHSLRVLQALSPVESHFLVPADKYIEIPDLQVMHEPEMALLNVQESQLFSKDKGPIASSAQHLSVKASDIKKLASEFDKTQFSFNPTNSLLDYIHSKEMFADFLTRNNFKFDETSKAGNTTNIHLTDQQSQLLSTSTELLRHFWKALTVTGGPIPSKLTPEKLAKLTRIILVLERKEELINEDVDGMRNLKEVILKAKQKYTEIIIQ